MRREKALDTIKDLPQEFELEDLIGKLVVIEKVEQGLAQLGEDKTRSHQTVIETVKKW